MIVQDTDVVAQQDVNDDRRCEGNVRGKRNEGDQIRGKILCSCNKADSSVCTCGQECQCRDREDEPDCVCDVCRAMREEDNKGEEDKENGTRRNSICVISTSVDF